MLNPPMYEIMLGLHRPKRKKRPLSYAYNDGGRVGSGISEHNDCSVRAISTALGIGYSSAHSLLSKYGRKPKHRFFFSNWMNSNVGQYLFDLMETTPKNCTVGQFLDSKHQGTFLCQVRGHCFTVIDGIIQDTWCVGRRTKLLEIWKPIY